jgi:glycerophosphoryl diester phosphodiesterase
VIELRRSGRPLLIGHRGAAALARENTLEAIEAAARVGVDGVELDVLPGRDGVVVVAHGPEVPPDAAPLPDALALVAELGLLVQIDVKTRGVEAEVVRALREAGLDEHAFVSSFSLPSLRRFAELAPQLPRALTYPEDRYGVSGSPFLQPLVGPGLAALRWALPRRLPRWLRAAGAAGATLNWGVVTPEVVEVCHRLGVAVLVWTVNDAGLAKILVESGVDAIITDDPRIVPGGSRQT